MDEIILKQNEDRKDYLLRVAGAFIEEHCPDGTIVYDEATCDGYCLSEECKIEGGEEE